MLADDRPAFPMEFFVRLRFAGRFDRAALEAAFSTALVRHPLLCAVVRQHGRVRYLEAAQTLPSIQWLDEEPTEKLPNLGPVNVRSGPAIRVAVLAGRERTDLVFQSHHTCTDGIGSFRFLEDMLISYAQNLDLAPNVMLPPLDLEQLRRRGKLVSSPWMWLKILGQQLTALPNICRFLTRTCEPLVEQPRWAEYEGRPADFPLSLTRRLTETETAGLIATCGKHGITVNDLLATEFLRSLRRSYAGDDSNPWLRICVPVNTRMIHADKLSAANAMSYTFLTRTLRDIENRNELLASIHHEMATAKRTNGILTFALSLGLCQKVPGLLKRMCHRNQCMATGVIANLGQVFSKSPLADDRGQVILGDLVLDSVEVLSTWRPLTSVAIAAVTYAGRLTFTLHYDPRALSKEQATDIIDGFTADVKQFAT